MIADDDWALPDRYSAECHADGRVTLWRHDRGIWDFRAGTSRKAIEAWAQAYDEGLQTGLAEGRALGRRDLAADLRDLVGASPASLDRLHALALETAATTSSDNAAEALPALCYTRHPTTGETVAIIRGEDGYRPANTFCSPACLNAKLAPPPTEAQISAMKHGSLMGWDTPGARPEFWKRREGP